MFVRTLGQACGRAALEFWKNAEEHFGRGAVGMDAAQKLVRLPAAWLQHRRTNQLLVRIAEQLGLHSPASVSQQVRRMDFAKAPGFSLTGEWRRWVDFVENC